MKLPPNTLKILLLLQPWIQQLTHKTFFVCIDEGWVFSLLQAASKEAAFLLLKSDESGPYFQNRKPVLEGKPFGLLQKLFYLAATKQANVVETLETNNKKSIFQDFIKKRVGPAGFEPATNGL